MTRYSRPIVSQLQLPRSRCQDALLHGDLELEFARDHLKRKSTRSLHDPYVLWHLLVTTHTTTAPRREEDS